MIATLVMTVMSPDRPGLVENLSRTVAAQGGNWLESRMCRLGGQFAGLIRVSCPAERTSALVEALRALEAEGLRLTTHTEELAPPTARGPLAVLELVGQDRPGILMQISRVLASHKVNVEELTSECVHAPIDGTLLFQAKATLLLPEGALLQRVRQDLEKIASDLMVDVKVQPAK